MKTKLNLGCGKDIKGGYINLDTASGEGIDVVHDLNKYPWPLEDNTFDEIKADMILEHLDEKVKPMQEMIRICKDGALIKITVPWYASKGALCHIDHRQHFSEGTFSPFYPKNIQSKHHWKEGGGGIVIGSKSDIKFEKREKNVIVPVRIQKETFGRFRKYMPFKKYLAMFLWNIYDHLYFKFKVIKRE